MKNKNQLKKNSNSWAINSLIQNTKEAGRTILAWKIVGEKKVTHEVAFSIIRKSRNEIIVKSVSSQNKQRLMDLCVGSQNLNFFMPDDLVLFQTKVKKIDPSGDITIMIPETIAQIDRRKHMRLFIDESIDVSCVFKKDGHAQRLLSQNFNKPCFDISAGGLSFIVTRSELKFFKLNDKVEDVVLKLKGESLKVEGEVVNILEVLPTSQNDLHYKGWKVCINFLELSDDKIRFVNDFVFNYIELEDVI